MKQQIKIGGTWHNVVAIHERGGERVAVFEHGDGLWKEWRDEGEAFELRTIDDGHKPTPHEPVEGVRLLTAQKDGWAASIMVDGEYSGHINLATGGIRSCDGPLPYTPSFNNENVAALGFADVLRTFRDRVRSRRRYIAEPKADELDDLIDWMTNSGGGEFSVCTLARIVRDRLAVIEGKVSK